MRKLNRFLHLPRTEQALLTRAFFLVAAIRTGLWILPFRVLRRVALRAAKKHDRRYSMHRLIWAVQAVSRYIPHATCLTQALAAQSLLAASGFESKLELGVAKEGQAAFEAHAWLVCGDQIVLGGPAVDRYIPLAAWEAGG